MWRWREPWSSGRAFCCGAHLDYFTDPNSPVGKSNFELRDNYLAHVIALYDRFEDDRVIRPLFGRDLSSGREAQKRFFAEWLGGPPRYSESAWGALYRHHEDLPITRALAERWLGHLRGALSAG